MLNPASNAEKYFDVVRSEFFNCISSESNVLEIGPFDGWFSELILQKNPNTLCLVEPNKISANNLKKKFHDNSRVSIFENSIFDCIDQFTLKQFDVIIIFGLMYHLASPFDLLEKVVNKLSPKYICIDNPSGTTEQISLTPEIVNEPGNRFDQNKTVGFSINLPEKVLVQAMNNLNYKCVHHRYMAEFEVKTKLATHIRKFVNDIQ